MGHSVSEFAVVSKLWWSTLKVFLSPMFNPGSCKDLQKEHYDGERGHSSIDRYVGD